MLPIRRLSSPRLPPHYYRTDALPSLCVDDRGVWEAAILHRLSAVAACLAGACGVLERQTRVTMLGPGIAACLALRPMRDAGTRPRARCSGDKGSKG